MSDRPVVVFDVNETLLDLGSMEPIFDRIFRDGTLLRRWFAELIIASQSLTLAGVYIPFGELGGAVLKKLGAMRGVSIGAAQIDEVREAVAAMPPYPEVQGALQRLRKAGYSLVTLTNNPLETAKKQLERGNLLEYFDDFFSIDQTVNRYKPAAESYALVERSLDLAPEQLCLVACHDWDVVGAAARGWRSAMIERPDNACLSVGPQPQFVAATLTGVVDQLLADA